MIASGSGEGRLYALVVGVVVEVVLMWLCLLVVSGGPRDSALGWGWLKW